MAVYLDIVCRTRSPTAEAIPTPEKHQFWRKRSTEHVRPNAPDNIDNRSGYVYRSGGASQLQSFANIVHISRFTFHVLLEVGNWKLDGVE
jgi:hypothetical protein